MWAEIIEGMHKYISVIPASILGQRGEPSAHAQRVLSHTNMSTMGHNAFLTAGDRARRLYKGYQYLREARPAQDLIAREGPRDRTATATKSVVGMVSLPRGRKTISRTSRRGSIQAAG